MAPRLDAMPAALQCVRRLWVSATAAAFHTRNTTRARCVFIGANWSNRMTEWHKPEVTEQEVGLEVTSYLPAELDS